jgi:aldehyde dehydrogenase (NAD+)
MRHRNIIGGERIPPKTNEYLPDVNPADSADILAEFPNSSPEDALVAVEAAAAAFAAWTGLSAHARGEYLRKAADILESRAESIAADLTREEGKSVPEAKGETLRAVTILRYYAAQTMLPDGEVIPSASAATMLYTRRIPLGVCVLITPWNFPIAIPAWKMAPALAFGNTVVLKPSEHTPLTAHHLVDCLIDAGIPPGVVNLLQGQGARFGEELVSHPAVAAVSFTGSVRAGKTIARISAEHGKKYQLEMGGKNAAVICSDANLEKAVELTVQGAFKSAGEKCTATSRVFVLSDICDLFVQKLIERTKSLKLGPGTDSAAYLGPVITAEARDRILSAIETGNQSGAKLLCGGGPPEDPALRNGFYVQPTILEETRTDSALAKEEIFGPVLTVMRADSLEHAIELVNDVDYGLSASIFTRDLGAATLFAERVNAGMIRINGETAGVEPQAPFGGMKASSSYSREQGLAARDFFTQTKTISIDPAD